MLKKLPNLKDIPQLVGKRVLLRASLNVPVKDGVVTNQFRINRAMPTINYLRDQGARVIIAAHIGRDPKESLKPVHSILERLCGAKWSGSIVGESVTDAVDKLSNGEVLLLENLRQDPREQDGDTGLAKELSELADIYVNDAFAASHRAHSSLTGLPQFLPSCFGFNFIHEYEELSRAMQPESPSLFILGGAKFETKLPLVERYTKIYDQVFVGGALANDVYKAKGYEVGISLTSDIDIAGHPILTDPKVLVPDDVTVKGSGGVRTTTPSEVDHEENILDAGPKTIEQLRPYVAEAKSILWNGPLGNFEDGFGFATKELAKLIANAPGYSIVGGGDTIAAIESLGLEEKFNFMSTAGGAMLTFLETGTLPAIDVVCRE